MLENTRKSVSLSGESKIDGQSVIYLSANIVTGEGSSSINQSINDQDLYNANRSQCRKDVAAFQSLVYEAEDQLTLEVPEGSE